MRFGLAGWREFGATYDENRVAFDLRHPSLRALRLIVVIGPIPILLAIGGIAWAIHQSVRLTETTQAPAIPGVLFLLLPGGFFGLLGYGILGCSRTASGDPSRSRWAG